MSICEQRTLTLYQCFFTLPSVRVGNVYWHVKILTTSRLLTTPTLAISLQLFPASRIAFNLCSSSAVHGVLVLPFFFGVVSEAVAPTAGLAATPPTPIVVEGAAMAEGICSGDGRRLRGFDGCNCVGCVGMGKPWVDPGSVAACCWASERDGGLETVDVLIRFEVGGDLSDVQLSVGYILPGEIMTTVDRFGARAPGTRHNCSKQIRRFSRCYSRHCGKRDVAIGISQVICTYRS